MRTEIRNSEKLIMALQHLITMAPASMLVPLVFGNALGFNDRDIAFLVSANFFINGVIVLLQSIGVKNHIGSRLPIIFGASFAPLAPIISISNNYGLNTAFGAIIVSAILMYIMTFFLDRVLEFFPPAVMGSFITIIGIMLAPIAMSDLAGGEGASDYGSIENIVIGLVVLVIVIVASSFGTNLIKSTSLLSGIVVGTLISLFVGKLDFTPVYESNWIELIVPFKFGIPDFNIPAILIMIVFSVINTIQCVGAFSVYGQVVGKDMTEKEISKTMRAQIVGQAMGGAFGAIPATAFNENIGLMSMTGVKNRVVIVITGFMLILLGFIPKLSSLITIIPKSVIGGATLALFGIIIASGISILSKVDYSNRDNITLVGTSISVGIGVHFTEGVFSKFPESVSMLLGNGLFMASLVAVLLNMFLRGKKKGKANK